MGGAEDPIAVIGAGFSDARRLATQVARGLAG